MKRIFIITGAVILILISGYFILRSYTKRSSPEAVATYTKNGFAIEVEYCRPSKRGRTIFGELEPYGKVWRTGANEATQINFKQPLFFGGKFLDAGKYTLFSIPEKDNWTIILNKELEQWGAFTYDETKDVLRVQVPSDTTGPVTEMFTIDFVESGNNTASMRLMWDKTKVEVPIKHP